MMGFLSRRHLRKWNARSRPHLVAFNRALDLITTATPANIVFVGDQIDAAADELAAYLQADPCPLPELAGAFASLVLISGSVANAFATWHRMAPLERQAAVERTRELGAQAEAIAGVLAPYASSTPPGAEEFPPFASAPGRRVSNSLEGR